MGHRVTVNSNTSFILYHRHYRIKYILSHIPGISTYIDCTVLFKYLVNKLSAMELDDVLKKKKKQEMNTKCVQQ